MNIRNIIAEESYEELYERLTHTIIPEDIFLAIKNDIQEVDRESLTDDEVEIFTQIENILRDIDASRPQHRLHSFSLFSDKKSFVKKLSEKDTNPFSIEDCTMAVLSFLPYYERKHFRTVNKSWKKIIDKMSMQSNERFFVLFELKEILNEVISHLSFSERTHLRLVNHEWKSIIDKIKIEKEYFFPKSAKELILSTENTTFPSFIRRVSELPSTEKTNIARQMRVRKTENLLEQNELYHRLVAKYLWLLAVQVVFVSTYYTIMTAFHSEYNLPTQLRAYQAPQADTAFGVMCKLVFYFMSIPFYLMKMTTDIFGAQVSVKINRMLIIDRMLLLASALMVLSLLVALSEKILNPILRMPGVLSEWNTLTFFHRTDDVYREHQKRALQKARPSL